MPPGDDAMNADWTAVDKIQLALDKRRGGPAPVAPGRRPQGGAAPSSRDPAALGVRYTRTAVVAPPPGMLERHGILAGDPKHPVADAFRVLRTQLLSELDARGGSAVAVCAANPKEGKTFVAANLAVSIASLVSRTAILVDLDLRRPSVHRYFGLEPAASLSDHLLDGVELERCLASPGIERLVLLMQAQPVARSSELLASPRMAALAAELRRRYPDRIVVYNTPPLLVADDAMIIAGYADGCLLVVREGRTERIAFVRAAELIGQHRFLGTVLNNARWSKGVGYGY
jgi:capsular exopolysaccharide synthesis family protein